MTACLLAYLQSRLRTLVTVGAILFSVGLLLPTKAHADSYSVSNTDQLNSTVRTLRPGDVLELKNGTYREFTVDVSGSASQPIVIKGESANGVIIDGSQGESTSSCIRLKGSYLQLSSVTATNCYQHGILIQGKNITVENSVVVNAAKANEPTPHVHWGSGLKVGLGGEDIVLRNNTVYHNWGEGIAITRGRRVTVEHNDVYDNFSVNVYIDNSSQVTVKDNFITCKPNTGYERDGRRALGISLSEESYEGWGAQLENVIITNNVSAYCHRGVSFYSAEVPDAGLRNSIISNNILWDSQDYSLYLGAFPETTGTTISNNIVQHNNSKVAKVISTQGLSFATNTWVGGTPTSVIQSTTDVFSAPSWLSSPSYTRESFGAPANDPLPSPTPIVLPSPSPISSPVISPAPSPTTEPLPSPSQDPVVEPSPTPSPSPTPEAKPSPIKRFKPPKFLEKFFEYVTHRFNTNRVY